MRADEIRKHLTTTPFQAFRVYIPSGAHYDVPRLDFMLVSRTYVVIGT